MAGKGLNSSESVSTNLSTDFTYLILEKHLAELRLLLTLYSIIPPRVLRDPYAVLGMKQYWG